MGKKSLKKLNLSKESLRNLTTGELEGVAGGAMQKSLNGAQSCIMSDCYSDGCPNTAYNTCKCP